MFHRLPHSLTLHEHEGHGPLREWTSETDLSNQWLRQLMSIYDMIRHLT